MAADFNISIHKDLNRLHVELTGDFDDESAGRLIEALKENTKGVSVVFIQAKGLRHIDPSGVAAFRNNLPNLSDFCYRLVFAGENASRIDPGWLQYF